MKTLSWELKTLASSRGPISMPKSFPGIDVRQIILNDETDLRPDVTLLVKGSRFMHMERIVAALGGATAAAH